MNNKFKYIASAMVVAVSATALTSCDDWTEPESVDVNFTPVDKAENYADYLANLREYRKADHKKVYAWVDCTEEGPKNQSERLTSLPDSIDVLVLSAQANIHPTVLADMKIVREQKAMEVVYLIDFDGIKAMHTALCEDLLAQRTKLQGEYDAREDKDDDAVKAEFEQKMAELADPSVEDYVLEHLTSDLGYAKSQNLDGVMFAFDGKASLHLSASELADYKAQQLLFLGAAMDWHKRNPELAFDFLGYPQNITDKSMFDQFRMLFVRQGLDATNANQYSYYLTMAAVEGVPAEKLAMMATFTSPDPLDVKTGMFTDGTLALEGFAKWLPAANVAGVGIQHAQGDYFNPVLTYPHIRAIIKAANPSIK